jgi:hypothetical protein
MFTKEIMTKDLCLPLQLSHPASGTFAHSRQLDHPDITFAASYAASATKVRSKNCSWYDDDEWIATRTRDHYECQESAEDLDSPIRVLLPVGNRERVREWAAVQGRTASLDDWRWKLEVVEEEPEAAEVV